MPQLSDMVLPKNSAVISQDPTDTTTGVVQMFPGPTPAGFGQPSGLGGWSAPYGPSPSQPPQQPDRSAQPSQRYWSHARQFMAALDNEAVKTLINVSVAYEHVREQIDLLETFGRLEPNWDSYGGKPSTAMAISTGRRLIGEVFSQHAAKAALRSVPYDVGPTPNGGVEVEWRCPAMDVAIEVSPRGLYDYLIIDRRGPKREMTEKHHVDYEEVLRVIEAFLQA